MPYLDYGGGGGGDVDEDKLRAKASIGFCKIIKQRVAKNRMKKKKVLLSIILIHYDLLCCESNGTTQ